MSLATLIIGLIMGVIAGYWLRGKGVLSFKSVAKVQPEIKPEIKKEEPLPPVKRKIKSKS